jgi:hypothetical protein
LNNLFNYLIYPNDSLYFTFIEPKKPLFEQFYNNIEKKICANNLALEVIHTQNDWLDENFMSWVTNCFYFNNNPDYNDKIVTGIVTKTLRLNIV